VPLGWMPDKIRIAKATSERGNLESRKTKKRPARRLDAWDFNCLEPEANTCPAKFSPFIHVGEFAPRGVRIFKANGSPNRN